jgi:hypothetical protein
MVTAADAERLAEAANELIEVSLSRLPEGWIEDYETYPDYMPMATPLDMLTPGTGGTVTLQTYGEMRRQLREQEIEAGMTELADRLEEEQIALAESEQGYLEWLMGQQTLSPEESELFEMQYDLEVAALTEQFQYESEQYGGKQMADLVARGVFDSTTGERAVAETTRRQTGIFQGSVAQLREAEQLAKSDFSAAKTEMAQQGYRLTSTMLQDSLSQAMDISMGMQNYYQDVRGSEASAALQRALDKQAKEQARYRDRIGTGLGIAGIVSGFA